MKLADRQIFADGEYPAGTPCELASMGEVADLLRHRSIITHLMVRHGHLRVVKIAGRLYILPADAIEE